jgi:hypothetical protein
MGSNFKWNAREFWDNLPLGGKIALGALGGIGVIALFGGMLFLLGWVFMSLWNWLMPTIFGLPAIDFWQGWGLMLLSWILFKKSPDSQHVTKGGRDKRRLREKLRQAASECEDCGEAEATASEE